MINSLPLSGSDARSRVTVESAGGARDLSLVPVRGVSPGYFRTMRIPVLAGRDFTDADMRSEAGALVNQTLARSIGGSPDPAEVIGTRIRTGEDGAWLPIVGVVGDVRHAGPQRPAPPEVYVPYSLDFLTSKSFVVRWMAGAELTETMLRDAFQRIDGQQPIREVRSLEEWAASATAKHRYLASLSVTAALVATVLAAVGLFMALSTLVHQRRREIAVRIAVGATRLDVLRVVLRSAALVVTAGLAAGGAAGVGVTHTQRSVLVGVRPGDPATVGGACALLIATAFAAAWWPARRAARTDPATILRHG
jgi:hypothetical protein